MVVKTARRVGSVLLSAGLAVSFSFAGSGVRAAPGVNCHSQFDAYHVSKATRDLCGIATWPLAESHPLSGGGMEYIYYINGHKTVYRVPPKGFDALNASNAVLADYFLPARPSSPDQLTHWKETLASMNIVTPPNFLVTLPYSAANYRTSWSGYDTTRSGIWMAYSNWNEVSIGSSCSGSSELTWTGIGGDLTNGSHLLGQIGTEYGIGGGAAHSAWW